MISPRALTDQRPALTLAALQSRRDEGGVRREGQQGDAFILCCWLYRQSSILSLETHISILILRCGPNELRLQFPEYVGLLLETQQWNHDASRDIVPSGHQTS